MNAFPTKIVRPPHWSGRPSHQHMRISDLRSRLQAAGAGPSHESRVLRLWSQALPQDGGKRSLEHFMPHALRVALPAIEAELESLGRVVSINFGEDGSERLLVGLVDGQMV